MKNYKYDIVLSFAGENRNLAEKIYNILIQNGIRVFYDKDQDLWGKKLYHELSKIYENESIYGLSIISKYYKKKNWTKLELDSMQAREFSEEKEYILTIKLDDTKIPGIHKTRGFIDGRTNSPEQIAQKIVQKVKDYHSSNSPLKTEKLPPTEAAHNLILQKYIKKNLNLIKNDILDIEKSDKILEKYSSLFSKITSFGENSAFKPKNPKNFFKELIEHVTKSVSKFPLLISGSPGSGKSEFLSALYLTLYSRFKKGDTKYYPVLINLHYYDKHPYKTPNKTSIQEQAKNLFESDFEILKRSIEQNKEKELLILIDGGDEYIHTKINIDSEVNKKLLKLHNKKIIGIRKYKEEKLKRFQKSERAILKDEPATHIKLHRVSIEHSDYHGIVSTFSEIKSLIIKKKEQDIVRYLTNKITRYNIEEVDLFFLNILFEGFINSVRYEDVETLSLFFTKYLENENIDILKAGELAFMVYNEKGKANEISPEIKNIPEWWVIQKHTSMMDFLVAYNVIHKIKEYTSEESDFKHIYPYDLNSFCKEILNSSQQMQSKVFDNIKKMFHDLSSDSQTHFCYLLGRFKNPGIIAQSSVFLKNHKEKLWGELEPVISNFSEKKLSEAERSKLLQLRTVFISLVYLGDSRTSDEYIKQLLSNKYFDNLNRGFHLEYYGDIALDSNSIERLKNEDNLDSFEKTYSRLLKKLNIAINSQKAKNYPMFEIEFYTLCSLAQHRFIVEKLDKEKKDNILKLIKYCATKRISISKILSDYMEFIEYIFVNEKMHKGSLINKLFEIKNLPRKGWVTRGIKNGETVGSHMYGAYLLGLIFLPDKKIEFPKYDKNKILNMVLIHDLCEVYIGDLLPKEKTKEMDEKQRKHFSFLGFMSSFDDFGNIQDIPELFEIIDKKNTSGNGEIAKDLDKLDNLLQLHLYKDQVIKNESLDNFIEFENGLLHDITSEEGKRIKDIILEFFKNQYD